MISDIIKGKPLTRKQQIAKWLLRDFSWSQLSSWEYDPEQWYRSYILGEKQSSIQMSFGSFVDNKLQTDPTFLPIVERYPIMQHEMRAIFRGVRLVGFADGYDPRLWRLKDDKTGVAIWDQKRADETGQITMYLFLLYAIEKIKPENMRSFISWLPTKQVRSAGSGLRNRDDFKIEFRDDPVVPVIIETRRTMKDLAEFGTRIMKARAAMLLYAKNHD